MPPSSSSTAATMSVCFALPSVSSCQCWVSQRQSKAELYKMLIYEKGAMFKAHTESDTSYLIPPVCTLRSLNGTSRPRPCHHDSTEKIPGMFGTLVICLPSPHEGGDVVVKHSGQAKTFSTSLVQPSVLCWYSDVHHEVLPVTSGYRCVLTYNLAIPP